MDCVFIAMILDGISGMAKEPGLEVSAYVEEIIRFIAPWTDFIVE